MAEIARVNPFFPNRWRESRIVQFFTPRQKPENVNPLLVIRDGAIANRFHRQIAYLHLDSDRDAIDVCGNVWADTPQAPLHNDILDTRLFFEGFVNLDLATEVFIALGNRIFARQQVRMREMRAFVSARFQQNLFIANRASKRPVFL